MVFSGTSFYIPSRMKAILKLLDIVGCLFHYDFMCMFLLLLLHVAFYICYSIVLSSDID